MNDRASSRLLHFVGSRLLKLLFTLAYVYITIAAFEHASSCSPEQVALMCGNLIIPFVRRRLIVNRKNRTATDFTTNISIAEAQILR